MNRSCGSADAASSALVSGSNLQPVSPARMVPPSYGGARNHVLTIALEDYYHASAFRQWIRQENWYRFEDRLKESTHRALDLLDRCGARATFFVGQRTAHSAPELVREVAERGHEIASWGEYKGTLGELEREKFREDALRCRERLEDLVCRRVVGFRMSSWLAPADLWMLDILADCGYVYDSSISPVLGSNPVAVWRRSHTRRARAPKRAFHEIPLSSLSVLGLQIPIARGGSFRHFPQALMRRAVAHWDRNHSDPYVMCFRTWELDPEQPRISAGPLTARIRHYRNLRGMADLMEDLLTTYRFTSVASHLGLELGVLPSPTAATARLTNVSGLQSDESKATPPLGLGRTSAGPTPVTIVIPCFNEAQSLQYLGNTLQSLAGSFRGEYTFTFVFVDDGSTDDTWPLLQKLFGARPHCRLLRHERNRGVAHSIQTGIRHAETQVVCSIDCDCTYDPHELGRMIPLLTDGVDLVTASPYHPLGRVRNVVWWRLFLSKSLSQLYRLVLHQKLFTYTSCFRVYRRETAIGISVERGGFFGITEMLGHLDLSGRRIVEFPATLDVRMLGRSKMKVLRTIAGHLGLLVELIGLRLRASRRGASPLLRTVGTARTANE